MEKSLLGASLRSRHDFELVRSYINMKASTYSKPFQIVISKVGDYYQRDADAANVIPELLIAQIAETIRNDKHVARFTQIIAEAIADTGSDLNVRAAILLAKQQEAGDKLSQALVSDIGNVDELIEEVKHLRSLTNLDELVDEGLEIFHDIDLSLLIAQEFDPASLIKVYPSSLNDRLDGGAKRGHHFVVFAPVEAGKSAFCINANCGFARQGFKSLYFINEDRPQDIIIRHVSNLSGLSKRHIEGDPKRAQRSAKDNGFDNIMVVSCAPGTPSQLEEYVEKYEPDVIVVDQLRNLYMKSDNRVNQLEAAATAVRKIAKKYNVLALSVTQAGDSATDKAVLERGDVDYSNVGIPAQADVMVGIGMTPALEAEGRRCISLPKNKLSGRHESFPVNIVPHLSRITSV